MANNSKRGFAGMSKDKQKAAAQKGGKHSHGGGRRSDNE